MNRIKINKNSIDRSIQELINKLNYRLEQKGDRGWSSIHEIYGLVTEEWNELSDAIRNNSHSETKSELLDIAVACVFGVACINQNAIDW